jgi:hypothetical protein
VQEGSVYRVLSKQRPFSVNNRLRTALTGVALVAGFLVLSWISERLAWLKELERWTARGGPVQHLLFACAIAIAVLGGILMLGAQFLPGPRTSAPPSDEELDAQMATIEVQETRGRFSRAFSAEFTFVALKEAWRRRAWRYNRNWRVAIIMLIGAALVLLGLCGVVFFIGPPVIKLLCLIFLAFVGVAALWAFAVG